MNVQTAPDSVASIQPKTYAYDEICMFLFAEARCLDDKEYEAWLEFYHDDVEFWMPAWE